MATFESKSDISDAYHEAKKHYRNYFEPFAEFERIARNKPHPKVIKAKLPSVTDGTLAAVVQAQPRRIIQQLPTGRIKDPLNKELALLAEFIWTHQILPNANTTGDALQKCWIAAQKAGTYGSQPSFQFFKNDGEYYGGDFMLPYVKDVLGEPGKLNLNDSEYVILQSWWTKAQIKARIETEKLLKKRAKERGEKYESGWNLSALAELLDDMQPKDQDSKSPNEDEISEGAPYGLIVHAFQKGQGATFYSYAPKLDKILRTKVNPDYRGCIPIKWLYDNLDLSNPFGRGSVELTGGTQNLLDSEMQRFQFISTYNMMPALMRYGNVPKAQIKYKSNQIIDMPADPNAKLDPLTIDSSAVNNFPTNYGLLKSQILNLTNNQDTSISSQSGNPSFSKTQAGVNAQEQRIAVDDNYKRKQFESWWEATAEDILNIHFAESKGTREIELTEEFIKKHQLVDYQGPQFAISGTTATVMYDEIKTKLRFEVDASTSKVKDDAEQKEHLLELLELGLKYPNLLKVDPIVKRIVNTNGVEDPEELVYSEEERMQQQQQAMAEQQAMAQEQAAAQMQAPQPAMAEPSPAPQPEQADDPELLDMFLQAGFNEAQARQGIAMVQAGYPEDQIMQALTQAQGGM